MSRAVIYYAIYWLSLYNNSLLLMYIYIGTIYLFRIINNFIILSNFSKLYTCPTHDEWNLLVYSVYQFIEINL